MGVVDLIRRLREEFTEMPGLRLTKAQVERLCTTDELTSASALRALVGAGFLIPMADGRYGRTDIVAGSPEVPRPQPRAGTPPSAWRRILCLVELEKEGRGALSTAAYSALRYATTLAVTHRARITALQVVTPPSPPSLTAVAETLRKSVFGETFCGLIDLHVAAGSLNEELIRVATDIHADLIVLGRAADAHQSLSRLPEILRRAPCPVLIVHPSGRAAVA
jgi:nucleotide-binding universal stress UspA family protein